VKNLEQGLQFKASQFPFLPPLHRISVLIVELGIRMPDLSSGSGSQFERAYDIVFIPVRFENMGNAHPSFIRVLTFG